MSGYTGRRAPNFSQYLDDLNAIPSPYDQSVQQQQNDPLNLDAELALFTNTEFFDFGPFGDMNMPLTYDPAADEDHGQDKASAEKNTNVNYMDLLNADLNHMPEYSSNDYSHTNSPDMQIPHSFSTVPQAHNGTFNNDASALDKVTPLASRIPTKPDVSSTGASPASPAEAPTPSQTAGTKRKQSHDTKSPDNSARAAAEEDKRRRNTAASARFRVKKKQREQALEHTVKEASDKNAVLEARVSQLELENKWLKNLITEKNNGETSEGQKSDVDIAQMFKKFLANQKTDNERSPTGSKIGVGTS